MTENIRNLFVFATDKSWHLEIFAKRRTELLGDWVICTTPSDLKSFVSHQRPRYIFFPHWSHIVDSSILESTECVCFHMTDVPYGRGGSPLQNLIVRGHKETMLTALRMTEILDGGPVYAKRPLSLSGSAAEIFERSADVIIELIAWISETEPRPREQEGDAAVFSRRKPSQSLIPDQSKADDLYDHIRMLDAPSYPHAYIDHGRWRVEFTDATATEGEVVAKARFRPKTEGEKG